MKRILLVVTISGLLTCFCADAQTPAPVATAAATVDTVSMPAALKLLQEMKAANAETLKKQEATLQQLEELQKAAEEIKVFSKRS